MSDFEYSSSSNNSFYLEEPLITRSKSLNITSKEINENKLEELTYQNIRDQEYIKQLENEIYRKNKHIKKLEKNILQLKDTYFECNSILTILYQKAQDISLEKIQAQIKNILSTWYKNEWLYILNK